jgi:hypothetical protein
VEGSDLVKLDDREDVPIAAVLESDGARAPRREGVVVPPQTEPGLVAVTVTAGIGDYRAGDEIWARRLGPDQFGSAMNRDVLVPRPAGRFLFGRLIGREGNKLHLLPLGAGQKQTVASDTPWIAVATRLIRPL